MAAPVPAVRLRIWRASTTVFAVIALLALAALASRRTGSSGTVEALRAEMGRELADQRRLLARLAGPLVATDTGAAATVIGQPVFSAYRRLSQQLLPFEVLGTLAFTAEYGSGRLIVRGSGTVPTDHLLAVLTHLGDGDDRIRLDLSSVRVNHEYRVRPGDTLESIARLLYGSPSEWQRLWRDNGARVADPNAITSGTLLMAR
jgi:nucleoid-associated protein YgaU